VDKESSTFEERKESTALRVRGDESDGGGPKVIRI
jgi:hypothetical protein